MSDAATFPDDIVGLKALLAAQKEALANSDAALVRSQNTIAELTHILHRASCRSKHWSCRFWFCVAGSSAANQRKSMGKSSNLN